MWNKDDNKPAAVTPESVHRHHAELLSIPPLPKVGKRDIDELIKAVNEIHKAIDRLHRTMIEIRVTVYNLRMQEEDLR